MQKHVVMVNFYFKAPDGNYVLDHSLPPNWMNACPTTEHSNNNYKWSNDWCANYNWKSSDADKVI
ncbi:MAG: hypothetical protein IPI10_14410 [Bacteroidetes bacterium]|nr:hypothetical protein [Bacteroidota bacterium]